MLRCGSGNTGAGGGRDTTGGTATIGKIGGALGTLGGWTGSRPGRGVATEDEPGGTNTGAITGGGGGETTGPGTGTGGAGITVTSISGEGGPEWASQSPGSVA